MSRHVTSFDHPIAQERGTALPDLILGELAKAAIAAAWRCAARGEHRKAGWLLSQARKARERATA